MWNFPFNFDLDVGFVLPLSLNYPSLTPSLPFPHVSVHSPAGGERTDILSTVSGAKEGNSVWSQSLMNHMDIVWIPSSAVPQSEPYATTHTYIYSQKHTHLPLCTGTLSWPTKGPNRHLLLFVPPNADGEYYITGSLMSLMKI